MAIRTLGSIRNLSTGICAGCEEMMLQRLLVVPILGLRSQRIISLAGSFLFSNVCAPDGKENKMKVVIRYETEKVTFELTDEDVRKMGRSVNIDLDELPEEEKQPRLQEACDEQYNRPDYNNWHKYWRHQGNSKALPGEDEDEADTSEPLMSEVADDCIFRKDEIRREMSEEDEAICAWIRRVLCKKPDIAEAFIATKYGGTSIRDYAKELAGPAVAQKDIEKLENSLSKKLSRAAKTLAAAYHDRDF